MFKNKAIYDIEIKPKELPEKEELGVDDDNKTEGAGPRALQWQRACALKRSSGW